MLAARPVWTRAHALASCWVLNWQAEAELTRLATPFPRCTAGGSCRGPTPTHGRCATATGLAGAPVSTHASAALCCMIKTVALSMRLRGAYSTA